MTTVAPLVTVAGPAVPRAEAEQSASSASRLRVVAYRGVRVPVPPGWEVHWLDRDPNRCVRLDRRAVYLGRPGPQPDCPARAVGRTETLRIEPLDARPTAKPAAKPTARPNAKPAAKPTARPNAKPAAKPTARPNAKPDARQRQARSIRPDRLAHFAVPRRFDHEAMVRLPEAGVRIHATYGQTPAELERVLRGTRTKAWTGARRGPGDPPGDDLFPSLLDELLPWLEPSYPSYPAPPSRPEKPRPPRPRPHKPHGAPPKPKWPGGGGPRKGWVTGRGFDTCTAPSLPAMAAWRRAYKVANIYMGGAARACAQPNLNRTWVRQVRRMGYRLIPTYVGLQAPCTSYQQRFAPEDAAEAARWSARDAVQRARALGIPRRNPVYYDMEVYNSRKTWCRDAVMTFVHHWTQSMRRLGYVPGVYSSAGSGIRDLGLARGIKKPPAIWFAHWDGRTNPYDCVYMSDRWWPPHRRIKQYRGGHRETHGGVTINVDNNMVDGRVY